MKILLLALALATPTDDRPGGGGGVTGTGEIIADALYCGAAATDADALACALRGSSAYPQGTHAAGILYLGGGEGVTKIAITAANCVGNYVDIGCNGLTATRFHYGAGLDFEGATDTLAAASLATNATTLTDVLATDATGTVYILPDATCVSIELATDDATCAAITDGSNAGVVVRGPFTATGGVHFDDDVLATFGNTAAAPDCQFEWDHLGATPDEFSLTCGGNQVFSIETGSYDLKLGGDLVMHQLLPADILNPDSILHASPIFDVAADDFSISSQGPFEGVNAAQTAGGDICAVPKTGAVNITGVTQAGTALDTIVFSGVKEDCSTYSVTLTEGTDYTCAAAASDAECVCNLKAAIDAHATLGPLTMTYRTDETCSDEKLAVFANPALTLVVTPSDTVNTVRVAGTAGSMVVHAPLTVTGAANLNGGANTDGGDYTVTPATGAVCIYDELGATCGTRADDSNAGNRTINSSDVWPFADAAKTPGQLILRGGLDSKTIGCVQATCAAADTITVVRVINGTSTSNTLTYGTDFCAGTLCTDPATPVLDNEAMATSLAAAIEALSGVGSTASGAICSGGVADSRCVGVTADRLTSSITIVDSDAHAACTVISLGADGPVRVADRLLVGQAAGVEDQPYAKVFGSAADTGYNDNSSSIGVFGEAEATSTLAGAGVEGYARTIAAVGGSAVGVVGMGGVTATSDTNTTTGVMGYAIEAHAGGDNVGCSCSALNSGTANIAIQSYGGDWQSVAASIGWHIVAGADTACDTTCTYAAVMGWNGTTPVNHDDATADICLCAGPN